MRHSANGINLIRTDEKRHLVITPKCRLSFPQLFKARSFQDAEGQDKKFQAELIFDIPDLKARGRGTNGETPSLSEAVQNVKVDQWGQDKSKWPQMNFPAIRKGEERVNRDGQIYSGYEGKAFLKPTSGEKYPPKILNRFGQPITDEQEIYGGCFVKAQLLARPYAFGKNFGVRFLLLAVMKVADGERFGGGVSGVYFETDEAAEMSGGFGDTETESKNDYGTDESW